MTDQSTAAAERSAHVERGNAVLTHISPVVEVAPGVWRLRPIVEMEERLAREARAAYAAGWRAGAEKMHELCADAAADVGWPIGAGDGQTRVVGTSADAGVAIAALDCPPVEYPEEARDGE